MRVVVRILRRPGAWAWLLAWAGCADNEPPPAPPAARPVTALALRELLPVESLQITGSVKAWKEQDVAFEVQGRVEWIIEMGTQVLGRWEEGDTVVVEGDQLAKIDPSSYQAAREVARAEVDYARVQLENVLPATVAEAQANQLNKQAEFDRIEGIPEQAREAIEPIRAKAELDMASAQVAQAESGLEAAAAAVARANAALVQAELDLKRTVLYAPFPGEVSDVYIEAGGYAQRGQSVAHVVMMDPIKVDVSVSEATIHRLKIRDPVRLFLPGTEEPTYGSVHEKATIADPETRTFRVSIITRNEQRYGDMPIDDPLLKHPRIHDYMYLGRRVKGDAESPYFAEENRALRKDDQGYFLWAAPDLRLGMPVTSDRPVITLRRFPVVPSEQRWNFQGIYLLRALDDIGDLPPESLVALDVPDGVQDGDQVVVARPQWMLRPGQLIPIVLQDSLPARGLYVPMNTIKPLDETTGMVFIAAAGKARGVQVRILDNAGELFRIEAIDDGNGGLLAPGAQVITDHVHFLIDGEPIRVVRTVELKP